MDADDDARTIGARARMIRRRRGLSLDVVSGLAGITGAYLSMLERGRRGFNRRSSLHFDFACALAQEGGPRDVDAIRHLDTADRIVPQRIRSDPIARDLVLTLIGVPGAGCGSWTRCVTASVSGALDLNGMSRPSAT